jgi:type 1 glutamine amidotransferase
MAKALFLAGDYYHNPQDAFDGAGKILEEEGYTVEYITDTSLLTAEKLSGKDLLVIHRDGMNFPNGPEAEAVRWMQPLQEEAIEQFVLSGGNFLALHNAGWNYPWQNGYRRTLGGYYLTHPPIARFQVDIVAPNHPVTKGVESYEIEDEQHWLWFDYQRVTLLLVNHGADGRQSAAGWAYEYGLGRVVFLANGHTLAAHQHPEFVKLKCNAARWFKKEV